MDFWGGGKRVVGVWGWFMEEPPRRRAWGVFRGLLGGGVGCVLAGREGGVGPPGPGRADLRRKRRAPGRGLRGADGDKGERGPWKGGIGRGQWSGLQGILAEIDKK